jgi:hypothetical protein
VAGKDELIPFKGLSMGSFVCHGGGRCGSRYR